MITGSSYLVGTPVRKVFACRGANVITATEEFSSATSRGDFLVCATGRSRFFRAEHVKTGAVVFDVGICVDSEGKVTGDVDAEDVLPKVSMLSPVPGGLGPLTVAFMVRNLYHSFLRTHGLEQSRFRIQ